MENVQSIIRGKNVGYIDLVASIFHFCYVAVEEAVFFKDINNNARTWTAIIKLIVLVWGVWLSYMLIESTQQESIKMGNRKAQIWLIGKAFIFGFYLVFFVKFFAVKRFSDLPLKAYRVPAEAGATVVLTIIFIFLAFPYVAEMLKLRKMEKDKNTREHYEGSRLLNE